MKQQYLATICATVGLLFSTAAFGEQLTYTIVAVKAKPDAPPIAAGVRKYILDDIRVEQMVTNEGKTLRRKTLSLDKGFRVGLSPKPQTESEGFGLMVDNDRSPLGFSWDWFEPLGDGVYEHLQNETKVRVRFAPAGDLKEVAEVEFLEDTTLEFINNLMLSEDATHRVLIKKGSVLRVAP